MPISMASRSNSHLSCGHSAVIQRARLLASSTCPITDVIRTSPSVSFFSSVCEEQTRRKATVFLPQAIHGQTEGCRHHMEAASQAEDESSEFQRENGRLDLVGANGIC